MEAMTEPRRNDLSRHLDELLRDDQHMAMPPKAPSADDMFAQMRDIMTRLSEPPVTRRIEVGSYLRFRHTLARRQGVTRREMDAAAPLDGLNALFGIPIFETDKLGPDEWRLLDGDGQVIREGTL
jgi:hypothetical protein